MFGCFDSITKVKTILFGKEIEFWIKNELGFSGVIFKGLSVAQNKWRYFSLSLPKTVGVSVAIRETQTQGKVWLFMGTRNTPSLLSSGHIFSHLSPTALNHPKIPSKSYSHPLLISNQQNSDDREIDH